ncbi:hypothetical protein T4D_3257 [Trichinella pseudospiralis]|uniref:Uncharacterized protein n=1 Tax=Trichinella pseudospiralis TaxID=6337 RepID=A0A0V1FB32_TRIPS|nr:hypothetical protein T4D_3257 [Trichinella pseudospiralis]
MEQRRWKKSDQQKSQRPLVSVVQNLAIELKKQFGRINYDINSISFCQALCVNGPELSLENF